ncbi:MAG: HAMP domain-containing histidine kinase [Clostridia bacterium]|nr:HAMP domain-containing histidine kinase [Clostridia bacterium]
MKKLKSRASGASIRWKLACYLAVFIAIVLIVTWFFQVYLLDAFYEHIKEKELTESGETMALTLHKETLSEEEIKFLAGRNAIDYNMSVVLCRIEEGEPVTLANVDATGRRGGLLSDDMLMDLCKMAHDNGGSYCGRFYGATEIEDSPMPWPFESEEESARKNARLTYVSLVSNAETGEYYLIVLNASLQPLASTVEILKTQFVWIAAILLLFAGVMVFLLYRHISAPLVSMNEEAKKLAEGKYDVTFPEKGYQETRELAKTLNYAADELSRVDRLQKELIANISHDLRTPLTMIKGYSEIMRDLPGENTPENMQVVIDETTRLSELVNDLLDISGIQSGSRKCEMTAFDLTAALEEIMHRYDTFVRHKGYKITVACTEHAWICADRRMILQVLYNLINNAINYTGEDLTVTITQAVSDGRVRISVSDTGEGIEPEQMPLIWDRYYKVDKVHKRAMIGTGLGLSIVKEILSLHDAAYGVDSTVGVGSTFWFELATVDPDDYSTQTNPEE